ncbi:long-chain fatty acid--CoA ligase [Schaalia sp. JY-X159]|uniref:AMP-dependent synthetase/ligase n=1 Tax=Schaalia sp. JY-X159 TaxID=2758575 RepID=UPI00165EA08D|nr:AMP-dependent synthetase/ligase [Schaalia sp. JY-X159]
MHQQHSTPLLVDIDGYRNVTELLKRRAEDAPQHVAFEIPTKSGDLSAPWQPISTQEFHFEVSQLAKGFIAAGVNVGDAVAIMSETRYEWAVVDLAAWFAGAVVVPIYDTASPAQVAAIIRDADVQIAVAGSHDQIDVLRQAIRETGVDALGVWAMSGGTTGLNDPTIKDLAARATEVSDGELEQRRLAAGPNSPATIVYTSGTTGDPKGAVLTHRNFIGQALNIAAAYGDVVHPGGNTIIFLPLAHVLARGLQLICIASGMRIAHLADPAKVVATLKVLTPTFLVVVPRVLQKVQEAAAQKAADIGFSALWRAACLTAIEWGKQREETDSGSAELPSLGLRIRHAVFDRLFFRKLRAVLGGRVDYILSGGATLDADLSLFFRGIGVPVIEGYGLTETTAPLTGNLPGSIRSGTVGVPLPGLSVRISDDGEVLARGIGVFEGYRDPEHNIDAFVDGYFRTGDLGALDADGRLTLNGRLKDVIVTATGKTVVPTAWENAVAAHPLISHAVMIGEGKPYLSAILLLDPEALIAWARTAGVESQILDTTSFSEITDSRLREELQCAVDTANALVARSEQVRRFAPVAANPGDSTLITPTMKIKRRIVLERGAHVVGNLYR